MGRDPRNRKSKCDDCPARSALKVIHTWATFCGGSLALEPKDTASLCDKALADTKDRQCGNQ